MVDPYVGEIRILAGTYVPNDEFGWMLCDGRALAIEDYTLLHSVIGTIYNLPGDDATKVFRIPNLSGRLPMGVGSAPDLLPRPVIGAYWGSENVVVQAQGMPSHSHTFSAFNVPATTTSPVGAGFAQPSDGYNVYVAPADGDLAQVLAKNAVVSNAVNPAFPNQVMAGAAHPNLMPAMALNFVIAAKQGLFPTMSSNGAPVLTGVYPASGPTRGSGAGGSRAPILPLITLTGYFGSDDTVYFGENKATVQSNSGDVITVDYPDGTGIVEVHVVSSGGVSSLPVMGGMFSYFPSVMALNPPSGPSGGGIAIDIVGVGLVNIASIAFGETVIDKDDIELVTPELVRVFAPPGQGSVAVTVTLADGSTTSGLLPAMFSYAPTIEAATPPTGPAAGGTKVTLYGANFDKDTEVLFGTVAAGAVTFVASDEISVLSPAGQSIVPIIARNAGGESDGSVLFCYAPILTSIVPVVGVPAGGDLVTINGQNFLPAPTVAFGSVAAELAEPATDTVIKVKAPPGTGEVDVTVTTAGGTSAAYDADVFSYRPVIDKIWPASGPVTGGSRTGISGYNLTPDATVTFGGVAGTVVSTRQAPTEIVVTPPASSTLQTVDVVVTTAGGAVTVAGGFTYGLAVTGFEPNSAPPDGLSSMTVWGNGFAKGATTVNFGDTPASYVNVEYEFMLACSAPPGTKDVPVTVTVGGFTSPVLPENTFTYSAGVRTLVSSSGPNAGGSKVMIFGNSFASGAVVKFGDTPSPDVVVRSQSFIDAVSPPGSGSVPVTVTTANGTSPVTPGCVFTYTPSILQVSPPNGGAGVGVTLKGVGFTGTSAIWFGNASLSSTAWVLVDDATIIVNAPPAHYGIGAYMTGPVHITLTSSAGTTTPYAGDLYGYPPIMDSLSGRFGPSAGGTEVTIAGRGLFIATEVRFGNVSVASTDFTSQSDTVITLKSPPGIGVVPVTVHSPYGFSPQIAQGFFSYPPEIGWISPTSTSAGEQIAITGAGMDSVIEVLFGNIGTKAISNRDQPGRLSVAVPSGVPSGSCAVRVLNIAGASAFFPITIN